MRCWAKVHWAKCLLEWLHRTGAAGCLECVVSEAQFAAVFHSACHLATRICPLPFGLVTFVVPFTVQLLARTIQGTYISEGGGFDYDQSWLCAM